MHSMASGITGIEVPTAASNPATSAEPTAGRQISLPCGSGCNGCTGGAAGAPLSLTMGSAGGCTSSGVPGGRGSVTGAVGGRTGTLICGA